MITQFGQIFAHKSLEFNYLISKKKSIVINT